MGVMGVPITFLDRWVPDSGFEVVKFRKGDDEKDLTYSITKSNTHTHTHTQSSLTSEFSSYGFRVIGQSGVIEPDGLCTEYKSGRPYIDGARKYARIFIKRV